MREPTRKNHRIGTPKVVLLVPDEIGLLAKHVLHGVIRVVVIIRSRKNDNGESHLFLMCGWAPPRRLGLASFGCSAMVATIGCVVRSSANLNSIALDNRICQQLVRNLRPSTVRRRSNRPPPPARKCCLANVLHSTVAERMQRVDDGLSLRIEHRRLQRDEHPRASGYSRSNRRLEHSVENIVHVLELHRSDRTHHLQMLSSTLMTSTSEQRLPEILLFVVRAERVPLHPFVSLFAGHPALSKLEQHGPGEHDAAATARFCLIRSTLTTSPFTMRVNRRSM